jgi:hypothetical protein
MFPGDDERRANWLMFRATRPMASRAKTYAAQAPAPATMNTSGMTTVGVAVGAMLATDWPNVSSGDRTPCLRPLSAAAVGGLADTLDEMLTEGFSRLAVGDDERHG